MALTNNTKFRRYELTINKKVNDSLQTTGGFPKIHSLLDSFGAYPAITVNDLAVMNDANFNTRINAFYDYLETTYSFFTRDDVGTPPSGIDAVLCPLDNTPAPAIEPVGDPVLTMEPLQAAQRDVYLTWFIQISEPAPQDITYSFDANIRDKNNNLIRTERLYGTIRQGSLTHDSYGDDGQGIYIAEADNNFYYPIIPEFVPGSISLNI